MKTFSYSLDHAGHRWTGSYASGYGAVNMNDSSQFNLTSSLFIIDPNFGSDYNPATPTDTLDPPFFVNDQGWVKQDSGVGAFSCSGQYSCNAWLTGGGDEGSEDLKLQIARDSTLTSEYIPESKTVAKQYLYDKLSADSILTSSHIEFENFIATHELDNIGYLHDVKSALKKYIVPDEDVISDLQAIDSLMKVYTDSLFAAGENEKPGLILQLNNLNAQRNSIVQQWKNDVSGVITDAENINSMITGGDDPVQNEKFLNSVTLLYLQEGKESIANLYNQLLAVAMQCPYKGGLAVYRARTLVSLFNDSIEFDDAGECLQQGIYRNASITLLPQQQTNISLIPNPANENFGVQLKGVEEGSCHVTIHNVLDQMIYYEEFQCKQGLKMINISTFPSGVYMVTVNANNLIQKKEKLIIIR